MKTKLLAVAALIMSVAMPAAALDIDITNHPDKGFLLGYKHRYQGDCDVNWWASQWDTEHIISIEECKGVSKERVYNDMMLSLQRLKETTTADNFADHYRSIEREYAKKQNWVDITDDENVGFFSGYKTHYGNINAPNVCKIKHGMIGSSYYLKSEGDCNGISKEKIYNDAVLAMNKIKTESDATSFTGYYGAIEENRREERNKKRLLCLDTHSGTYIFAKGEAQNKRGWNYLTKLYNGRRLRSETAGFWKNTSSGGIIVDFGLETIQVNMDNVYKC